MNVWQAYRSLGPEQKQVLKEKQFSATRPVDELLSLLKPLAAYDRLGDKSRARLGCGFALSLLLGFIALIVAANHLGKPQLALVALLVIAIVVALGVGWSLLRKADLSDNLRTFALPVLALFREDIDPSEAMQIRLDLRPPLVPAKKTGELPPTKKGAYYKIVETQYVDPWLDASATLADGSRLRWSITDSIRVRHKTKKTPRGKIKTKLKYAKKTEIAIELAMKKKSYDVAAGDDASIKSGETRNSVRLSRTIKSDNLNSIDPSVLIDAIAEIYRGATPAK